MQPVLGVPDVDRTVAYYRDVLGFHVDFVHGDPPIHARVCADPSYSSPTVHIRFEPLERGCSVCASVYLWLHVGKDLDRLFRVYRDRGVTVVREPGNRPWGARQFIIEDCNRYLISFSAGPSA
jgi:catechol 2,3-dioxygenase-like lactoylglutathione lyase family enzyme